MEDITDLKPSDLRATLSRNTGHYRNAILLARQLLGEVGRIPVSGAAYARTFLVPTPRLVERGILQILREHLGDQYDIRPRSLALDPSSVRVNPDLVFDHGTATGDVKYKLLTRDWGRSDLYQAVAFAESFKAEHGCVVGFSRDAASSRPPAVLVGRIHITPVVWRATTQVEPVEAAVDLVGQISGWLTGTAA